MDCFNNVREWILQKLDSRFNEKTSELLICSAVFSPKESFCDFNLEHLMSLTKLYPSNFDDGELRDFTHHFRLYIADVRAYDRFSNIESISELSFFFKKKKVETRKYICYPLVYRLLKLALVLHVVTATVDRCFSAVKIMKTYLRNHLSDEFLSDSLIYCGETQIGESHQ